MSTALYISRQLSTLSDSPRLICFFLVWVFVSFPYFWIKETKTFQANEHKLHGSLKQPLWTPLFTPALPPSCSWTVLFQLQFPMAIIHQRQPKVPLRLQPELHLLGEPDPAGYQHSSCHEHCVDLLWLIWRGFSHPWAHDTSSAPCSHPLGASVASGGCKVGAQTPPAFPDSREGGDDKPSLSLPMGEWGSGISLTILCHPCHCATCQANSGDRTTGRLGEIWMGSDSSQGAIHQEVIMNFRKTHLAC